MTRKTNAYPKMRQGVSRLALLLCAGMLATIGTEVDAAQTGKAASAAKPNIWKDIGASERIDLSGRLHMLSQRIAASTCSLEAGVQESISKGIMAGSADEMDRIVNALENGNPLMKVIGAEEDPRVLRSIKKVTDSWAPIRAVIDDLHANGTTDAGLAKVEAWNIPYFDDANLLVSEISAEYSNPADLLQRDAILVDLAGRQRMRTQMMLKQACELWLGKLEPEVLVETIGIFDRTLNALLNGADDVGISKAPTEALEAALVAVKNDWTDIQPTMVSIVQGAELSEEARTALYLSLNEMLIKSDLIVTRFTKHAKNAY